MLVSLPSAYAIILSCWIVHSFYEQLNNHFLLAFSILACIVTLLSFFRLKHAIILLLIFSISAVWTIYTIQQSLNHQLSHEFTKHTFDIKGKITKIKPANYGNATGYKLTIDVNTAEHTESQIEHPLKKIQVYAKQKHLNTLAIDKYNVGDYGQWLVKLKPPHGFASPGSFSYQKWLISQDISATGSVRELTSLNDRNVNLHSENSKNENRKSPVSMQSHWLKFWQNGLKLNHNQDEPISSNHALIYALLTGDKSFMQTNQKQILQNSGTSHLFAISGMHLGMIALFINLFLKFIGYLIQPLTSLKVRITITLVILTLFAFITGWQPPITRALLMLSFLYVTWLSSSHFSLWRIFIYSMAISIVINPNVILGLGFWLSFGAFFFIIIINSKVKFKDNSRGNVRKQPSNLSSLQKHKQSIINYLILFLKFQTLIIILLFPLTAYFFNQFTPAALLSNLIAIPLMTAIIMPCIAISIIVQMLISLESQNPCIAIAVWLIEYLFSALNLIQTHISIWPIHLSQTEMIITSLLLITLYLLSNIQIRLSCLAIITLIIFSPKQKLPHGIYQVNTLDIGQGLALVIQTQNQTLIFDTGNRWSDYSDAMRFVGIPYLLHNKINTVDHVILSHGDNDHMGAFSSLDDYANIKNIWHGSGVKISSIVQTGSALETGDGAEKKASGEYTSESCLNEGTWTIDGIKFQWLAASHANGNDNHRSCVLYIESDYGKTLIPSDIDIKRERLLLERYPQLSDIDLLIAPHHGSQTSSSNAFLKALAPKHAIFSSGFANHYNHPHPKVEARYKEHKIKIFNTAETGTVEFTFDETGTHVNAYRESQSYWWLKKKPQVNQGERKLRKYLP